MTSIAIVGGGVSGCAAARALATRGIKATIFEMGRGVGGRMATRRSKDDKSIAINHGAPIFEAKSSEFRNLMSDLDGFVEKWDVKEGILNVSSGVYKETQSGKFHYRGTPGMSSVCEGLISDLDVEKRFRTMVKGFEKVDSGWRLIGRDGDNLGDFNWIMVTSSSLLHNRWTKIYGGPPPLEIPARSLKNSALLNVLNDVQSLTSDPIFVVMQAFSASESSALSKLPFEIVDISGSQTLSKAVISQGASEEVCNLVIHSSGAFGQTAALTHGRGGTAEAMGARSDSNEEDVVISTILNAFENEVLKSFGLSTLGSPIYGPKLHRWGAAFPSNIQETRQHSLGYVFPECGIAFAGDFLALPGGSVEQACLSGLEIGEKVYEKCI